MTATWLRAPRAATRTAPTARWSRRSGATTTPPLTSTFRGGSHKAPANARYGDYKTCYGIGDHPTNLRGPFAAGKEDCEDACDQDSQCTHYVMQGGAACTLSKFGPMKTRTLYIKDPSGRK